MNETSIAAIEQRSCVHELKTLPAYFQAVADGLKPFEIRRHDRDFREGDILVLREHMYDRYTGRRIVAIVTYTTDYAQSEGYVVLGIKVLNVNNNFH